ncbi:hypothetical protein QCA50_014661 [Cerrena zonata]|uniref:Uncharacterized protein n=1 Tax=Cerrena zonata TaxID=2478898 RepID=A0AAW0FZ81_9APHY
MTSNVHPHSGSLASILSSSPTIIEDNGDNDDEINVEIISNPSWTCMFTLSLYNTNLCLHTEKCTLSVIESEMESDIGQSSDEGDTSDGAVIAPTATISTSKQKKK